LHARLHRWAKHCGQDETDLGSAQFTRPCAGAPRVLVSAPSPKLSFERLRLRWTVESLDRIAENNYAFSECPITAESWAAI